VHALHGGRTVGGAVSVAESKRWCITTSGEREPSAIAADLADRGLSVEQVLDQVPVIIGVAPDDVRARLQQVPGVVDVQPDQAIDVGPPDAPNTW
jgi:small ligand-binding sensory domain FIST